MSGVPSSRGVGGTGNAGSQAIVPATAENIRNQRSAFHLVPITPGKEHEGYKIVENRRRGNWFTRLFHRASIEERRKNYQSWQKAIEILHPDRKGPTLGALKFYYTHVTQKHGKIDLTPASIADLDRTVDGVKNGNRKSVKFVEKLVKEQCVSICTRGLNSFCNDKRLDLRTGAKKQMVQHAMAQAIAEVDGKITSRKITARTKKLLANDLKNRYFPGRHEAILLI